MNEWHDLFVATAGASAALTGLIFVGVSINLARILAYAKLPSRALLSLILLASILIVSLLLLIPGQGNFFAGIEVLLVGSTCWIASTVIGMSIAKKTDKQYKKATLLVMLMDQLATFPYIIAAILLLFNSEQGFYFIVAAFVLSIIKSLIDAWVLLIEINR
jgi:modulator of FtsH protease